MRITTAALALLLSPGMTAAHHSRAEFADETVELVGEITNVISRNPHIAIFLDVLSDDGEIEKWRVETFGAPGTFEDGGVTRDLFQNGDQVTIAGRVSTARPSYILGTNALFSSGSSQNIQAVG